MNWSHLAFALTVLLLALAGQSRAQNTLTFETGTKNSIFALTTKDGFIVEGAVIDIEDNYQKGADTLVCDYQGGTKITQVFTAATGVLQITGKADITEYTRILNSVKFMQLDR